MGKNQHAIELGRLGRAVNSLAQQEASRINGRRGGRPREAKSARQQARIKRTKAMR